MPVVLRYQLLGALAVLRDGRDVDLGPPKQRAVLAVLAQHAGNTVSTDRLLDAVWGDRHPASVSASLQSYVSRLRRVLRSEPGAPSPVVRRARGYLLDVDPEALDVHDFLRTAGLARQAVEQRDWAEGARYAQQALEMWRGPYLADLADEDWVRAAAVPLAEHRQGVQQDQVVALLGAGDLATALARASVMTAEQPLVERAAWLHAVALHRAGRTAEALAVHQRFRSDLADELGLDAGPAMRDLHASLLRQDPVLAAWPGTAPPPTTAVEGRLARPGGAGTGSAVPGVVEPDAGTAVAAPVGEDDHGGTGLVGRQEQLSALDEVLANASSGAPGWLVLTGQPGIGKTRLAQEAAARWSATTARVARASCPDDGAVPSFWPVRQLLAALGADPDDVLADLDADADAVPFRVLDRARGALLSALRAGPVMLFVDDVQWADRASLHWLTFLADTVEQERLVVVLTARSGVSSPDLQRLLASAARRPGGRQLLLPPLSAEQVGDLVAQISGERLSGSDARELAERSDGNPFFASEFARLDPVQRRQGVTPTAVRSVLRRRLAGLPGDLLEVLSAAAVLADPLDVTLLSAVTGRDVDDLADLLDDAADRSLLAPALVGASYSFAHALLRNEVLDVLPATQRRRLHLRAARALHGSTTGPSMVRRASHLQAAGSLVPVQEMFEVAQAVAAGADRDWQPDLAAMWWDITLATFEQLPEQDPDSRRHLVRARVRALTRAGRGQAVLDALDAAVVDALREGRTAEVGSLAAHLIRVSGSWPWPVYGSDAAPLLATLRAVVPRLAADPAAQSRVLAASAIGHCYDPDPDVPDRMSATAVELAEATGDPDVLADALLGRAMTYAGVALHAEESLEVLGRLGGLGHELADLDEVLIPNLRTMAHLCLGQTTACALDVEAGAVGSDLRRLQLNRVQLRWAEAALAQWHGDLDRAERLYARAELSHRQTELQQAGTFELAELILRWERGRLAETAGQVPSNPVVSAWTSAVAAAAAGLPGADEALATEVHRREPVVWTSHGRLAMLAHAVADRGLVELAAALRQQLAPFTGYLASIGQIGVVGPVDLALARLADLERDRPAAVEHLARAQALAARAGGAPSQLRCRVLAASWAVTGAAGERAGLRVELTTLRAEASSRGMTGLVHDTDRALAALARAAP